MAQYSFETKALKRFKENQANKAAIVAKDILQTPFPMEYEYQNKDIYAQVEELGIEFNIKCSNVIKRFSIVGDLFSRIAPKWNIYAFLIFAYINGSIEYNSNNIKLTEEDFKSYTGFGKTSFYEGLNCLLRPDSPTTCAGDALALLARTTKKSIYIVNHNMIFKGKLEKFIELYKEKFPEPCQLDSRGKVIINN